MSRIGGIFAVGDSSKRLHVTLAVVLVCSGCAGNQTGHVALNSVAWMQTSEEFRALSFSAYNMALRNLDDALEDNSWTALPSQVPGNSEEQRALAELPPAVILDIDETVLSTLPYQSWLVKNDKPFSQSSWNQWISQARAEAMPGSLDFVQYAMHKGVTVFYLSNRAYRGAYDSNANGQIDPAEGQLELKRFTVSNLVQLGFLPQKNVSNESSVLLRGETGGDGQVKRGWASSDKSARRASLASNYRILLLIGDSLGDFTGYRRGQSEESMNIYRVFSQDRAARRGELEQHHERWGRSWIILPNPLYGYWENSLYNFNHVLPAGKKHDMKRMQLDTWQ